MSSDRAILCVRQDEALSYNLVPIPEEAKASFYDHIHQNAVGVERSAAETDPTFKQIIPYIVVHAESQGQDYILCGRRLSGGNEGRLHGRITLGFGGHVKWEEGLHAMDMVYRSIEQELREELGFIDPELRSKLVLLGELDADVDDVGTVHRGLVYLLQVDLADPFWFKIASKEPDKLQLFWAPLPNLALLLDRMEEWAKLTYVTLQGLVS